MQPSEFQPNDLNSTQYTHVNAWAHVSANECFLLSELLASNEGEYFHRVEWRKIERVYCSEHCSPFHSHSCVNTIDVPCQTVCMCAWESSKSERLRKVNAPRQRQQRWTWSCQENWTPAWLQKCSLSKEDCVLLEAGVCLTAAKPLSDRLLNRWAFTPFELCKSS